MSAVASTHPYPLTPSTRARGGEDPWVIASKLFGPDYYIGGVDGVRALGPDRADIPRDRGRHHQASEE